ncbi:MAG: hypothetical protein AB7W16_27465 [Candidatus Obscuribacterales bacterium]
MRRSAKNASLITGLAIVMMIVLSMTSKVAALADEPLLPPEPDSAEAGAGTGSTVNSDATGSQAGSQASSQAGSGANPENGSETGTTPPGVETESVTDSATGSDTSSAGPSVVPGPLAEARQQLLNQIMVAKENGVGIASYMSAFKYIEEMASKGASEEDIKKRMIPLVTALSDQLKTKASIEQARLDAQTNPRKLEFSKGSIIAPGQAIPQELTRYGGMGGAGTQDLIDSIVRNKMGGNLPQGVSAQDLGSKLKDPNIMNKLKDPAFREKLSDPRIQDLIRKYKGQ